MRIPTILIVLLGMTHFAHAQSSGWIDCSGRHWHTDGRGLMYFEVESHCVIHRVYRDPVRYEIARRVESHLHAAGFPASPHFPVIDRRLIEPRLGFVPSQLDQVDWKTAVRNGVRGAIIRGFNGMRGTRENSGRNAEVLPMSDRLQRLVEQGVEDAMIDGFNRMRVEPTAPLSDFRGEQLPKPLESEQTTEIRSERQDDARKASLNRHLAEKPEKLISSRRYHRFDTVDIGWYVDHDATVRPIELEEGMVIAFREKGSERADLWHEGRTLHEYILFARYYEDAVKIKGKYY